MLLLSNETFDRIIYYFIYAETVSNPFFVSSVAITIECQHTSTVHQESEFNFSN